jgi:hypothetical protein
MSNRPSRPLAAALFGTALALGATPCALAQAADGWQFEASINGWFPAIGGTTRFPSGASGPSIDVSMGDVVDALKFTFQGSFEARRGAWGVWTDLVYADFGATRSGSRDFEIGGNRPPANVTARLQLDVKSWIWTLAGLYGLKNDDEGTMDLLFGTRLLDMTNDLGWSFSGSPSNLPPGGSAQVSGSWWDAIVGLKGRALLGADRRWFVPYYVDVGTGQTDLTWQINAGLGYRFGWGAVTATWRYLDYDFDSSSKLQDISFNGPVIGVSFRF